MSYPFQLAQKHEGEEGEDDGDADDDGFCEYTILKEVIGEDGEAEWVSIDDDDEFDDVADYFDNLFSEEIDYDATEDDKK